MRRIERQASQWPRIAMPAFPHQILYHHTDFRNRDSIAAHGLLAEYSQANEPEYGGTYALVRPDPQPGFDTWVIDTSQLPHPPEPDLTTPEADWAEDSYFIPGDIPPHVLRLLPPPRALEAATQLLLPGMPNRKHQPDQEPLPEYPEGDWWRASWYMNKPEPDPEMEPEENEPEENDTWWRYEPWMHVSPHKLEPGTVLVPRGGKSPYGGKILAPGHDSKVWIDHPHKMKGWADEMSEYGPGPLYFYDVEPDERPEANVLGSELGWGVPSARILQRREGFDPENPDD